MFADHSLTVYAPKSTRPVEARVSRFLLNSNDQLQWIISNRPIGGLNTMILVTRYGCEYCHKERFGWPKMVHVKMLFSLSIISSWDKFSLSCQIERVSHLEVYAYQSHSASNFKEPKTVLIHHTATWKPHNPRFLQLYPQLKINTSPARSDNRPPQPANIRCEAPSFNFTVLDQLFITLVITQWHWERRIKLFGQTILVTAAKIATLWSLIRPGLLEVQDSSLRHGE